jgi:hypothetical protein
LKKRWLLYPSHPRQETGSSLSAWLSEQPAKLRSRFFGRTWMHGRNSVVVDVFNHDAAQTYRDN